MITKLRINRFLVLATAIFGCTDSEDVHEGDRGQRVRELYDQALNSIHSGKLDAGAEILSRVLVLDSTHYEARLGYGEILMRQRKFSSALVQMQRAAQQQPDREEARMQLGRLMVLLDRREEGREILIDFVGDFPSNVKARMLLADLLMTRAPPDPYGALEQYEAVLKTNSENLQAREGAAASRLRLGDFERAAEEMRELLAATSGKSHLAFLLGAAQHWQKNYPAAIEAYRNAIDATPLGAEASQRIKWNLRLAHLAQHGSYPGDLPEKYRINLTDLGKASPVTFDDVATDAGVAKLDRGRGNAWGDYDGDGDLDLFSVGIQVEHSLYRNEMGDQFIDVALEAGLSDPRGGWSATCVDYDNDGDLDLYATRDAWEGRAPNSLYQNQGEGIFNDVGKEAGVDDPDASFTAAWGDVDNDGFVDLYVADGITGDGARNKLYISNGMNFKENAVGFGVANSGKSLGVAFGDYDIDGDVDLYVADVGGSNTLYRNEAGSHFVDVTKAAGVGDPKDGGYVTFFADFDRDGATDLFVSAMCYYEQFVEAQIQGYAVGKNRAHLYRNLGRDRFLDVAVDVGISRNFGTMGAGIGDIDYDGLLDLYFANGGPVMPRFEPNTMYHNQGDRFSDVTKSAGVGNVGKGHGATFADFDADGDLDLYASIGGHYPGDLWPNSLYRNNGHNNHWVTLELEGNSSNRSAIGARVILEVGKHKIQEEISSGGGFGTTNSLPLEIGLGSKMTGGSLDVFWPSGQTLRLKNFTVDSQMVIKEHD